MNTSRSCNAVRRRSPWFKQFALALFVVVVPLLSCRADLAAGLVAYYPFDGDANDASGNGNNGTLHGSAFDNERISGTESLRFNGSGSSYVLVPRSSSLEPSDAMTIALWCKGAPGPAYGTIIRKANHGQSGFLIRKRDYRLSDSPLTFLYSYCTSDPYSQDNYWSTFSNVNATKWTHLAVTYSYAAGLIKTYIDGTQIDSTNIAFQLYHTGDLYIGGAAVHNGGDADGGFLGLLDDVRIYNRALSATEIAQLYGEPPTPLAPQIITQPTNRTANAGTQVSFFVTATGDIPLTYQWRFNGQNIAGATNTAFTISNTSAPDSGGYSVLVANTAGTVASTAAHLAILSDGANGSAPGQPATRPVPPRQPNQNNLIVVTHGWEALGQNATWVDDAATAIQNRLTADGKTDWQVVPIHWNEAAWGLPVMALAGARIVGALYGAEFSQVQWQHIHLIAHSAGSVFVEAFAKEIKEIWPVTEIHCTYLDPYLSIVWGLGASTYGQNSDWSDSYFAADETAELTRGALVNAHNVDVTRLDPDARHLPFGVTLSSHGWPYKFYSETVGSDVVGAGTYGYSMSKEGGGWTYKGNYPMNNLPVVLGNSSDPTPRQRDTPFQTGPVLALDVTPINDSGSGASLLGSFAFSLSTTPILSGPSSFIPLNTRNINTADSSTNASAAWLAIAIAVTSAVNFVQFDAEFTSTNIAQGLLNIFWNTNQIGMIDERTASAGLQSYRFQLPDTLTEGVFSLSFRLDSFSTNVSSATITNVATGFVGIEGPITMAWLSTPSNALPVLQVNAPTGYTYLVQTSTNLSQWELSALFVNTNSPILFADPENTNLRCRFYKAVLP